MDIEKIRNEALTEDTKMEAIADYLNGGEGGFDLDKVLANGSVATGKDISLRRTSDNKDDETFLASGTITTQKRVGDGVAVAQLTSEGSLFLEYQPDDGQMTYLHVRVGQGTPRIDMSEDMKDVIKMALDIS